MQIATGQYTGDGTNGRVIPTGLSGRLRDATIIGIYTFQRIDTMAPGMFANSSGGIIFNGWNWNGTDFVIDASTLVLNTNFAQYFWVAISE